MALGENRWTKGYLSADWGAFLPSSIAFGFEVDLHSTRVTLWLLSVDRKLYANACRPTNLVSLPRFKPHLVLIKPHAGAISGSSTGEGSLSDPMHVDASLDDIWNKLTCR